MIEKILAIGIMGILLFFTIYIIQQVEIEQSCACEDIGYSAFVIIGGKDFCIKNNTMQLVKLNCEMSLNRKLIPKCKAEILK